MSLASDSALWGDLGLASKHPFDCDDGYEVGGEDCIEGALGS
jgi:hypothetical protein